MVAVVVVAAAVAASPAARATAPALTGVSDAGTAFFDEPHYRALALQTVRIVLPWDAGKRRGPWDTWLERADRDGADVMVALAHGDESACPRQPCTLPTLEAYEASLRALVDRHPQIRHVVPWNEPNHGSQPTAGRPEAAAAFVAAARRGCGACTVVAGSLLDDASMPSYLDRYRRALTVAPDVWGLHSYWDTTYFTSRGIDALLGAVDGRVWITETGGLVAFGALPYDEERAAASLRWAYALTDARPRVERMYLHQWQGTPDNPFDSGLLDYAGRPRPGYDVVARRVGPRTGSGAPAAGITGAAAQGPEMPGTGASRRSPALRVAGKRLRLLAGRRLALTVSCAAAPGARCQSVVRVRVAARVGGRVRVRVTLRGGRSAERTVRVSRSFARGLARARRPKAQVQVCSLRGWCAKRRTLPVRVSPRIRRAARG